MTLPRATILSLLCVPLALTACTPGNVCIGDCPDALGGDGDDESTSSPTDGMSSDPTTSATEIEPGGVASTGGASDTDTNTDDTTDDTTTGTPLCNIGFEDDFQPLDNCGDGVQNPREFCFVEGGSTGFDTSIVSAWPAAVDGGGVDILVSNFDHTITAMLDGPADTLDYSQQIWKSGLPSGRTITLTGAGDLDGDGITDVVGHSSDAEDGPPEILWLFLISPDGSLKTSQNFGVGPLAFGPAVVDFDHDGNLDLVAVLAEDETIVAVFGDGAGTFDLDPLGTAFGPHQQLALGVLDPDGTADDFVLTTETGLIVSPNPSGPMPVDLGVPALFHAVEISELNNDGRGDIVVLFDDLTTGFTTLGVLLRTEAMGAPQFDISFYPVRCGATVFALGDIDGDGALDIAASGPDNTIVSLRRGDGQGKFDEIVHFVLPSPADRLFIADFNGNGAGDVLAVDLAGGNLGILENTP